MVDVLLVTAAGADERAYGTFDAGTGCEVTLHEVASEAGSWRASFAGILVSDDPDDRVALRGTIALDDE